MRLCALFTIVCANAGFAQPQPLHTISTSHPASEISILRVDLQDLMPAHEGPSYFSVKRAPFRGKQEVVEVSVYGQEGIGTLRFELLDESGRVLRTVPAIRTGDAIDADEYLLKIDVPQLPFRLRIRGLDLRGQPFENTFRHLFVPAEGNPAAPIPAELEARFQPGEIRMPRAGISGATFQPLTSANGNPIGLRVSFTARFDTAGYFDLTPHVFPVYQEYRWRGEIGMTVLGAVGGPARYEANTDYHLTYDFVPAYVVRRPSGYCMQMPARLDIFEAIMASTQPVKYRVDVSSLDFFSETTPLAPQRAWFEGFRKEGAADCGRL